MKKADSTLDVDSILETEQQTSSVKSDNVLVEALQSGLREFGVRLTRYEILDGMPPVPEIFGGEDAQESQREWAVMALQRRGMLAVWQSVPLTALKPALLPVILRLKDSFVVLCSYTDQQCQVIMPELGAKPVHLDTKVLLSEYDGEALLFRPEAKLDRRSEDLIKVKGRHWFWHTVWHFKRYIVEAVALSAIINVLALAMSIFTMTVYNRVLPNQTYVTLWTLSLGVGLALLFELGARVARAWVLDRAGKKIDLLLGARIFRHVLSSRMENRAQSSGAFSNVMQSFETVRDLVTSAALTAVADLPFVFLFLAVIYMVAGPLVWCVIAILLTIVIVALLMQIPLKHHSEESMKIGSNRQGLVIESLDNLETIKALRAERRIATKHDVASVQLSAISMKSRFLSTTGSTLIQSIQQMGTVVILLWGAYLVGDGTISMGGIIATMTLMGRAIAPIGTLSALALRFQQARTSLTILNRVMGAPVERDAEKVYVQLPQSSMEGISCRGVGFCYKQDLPPVINGFDLSLKPGERIAILGKMGSGKSTLLRLLVGLYQPNAGEISIDGVDLRQVDPSELRSRVSLVTQETRLMFGTLRDNLLMGAPHASDEEMLKVAMMTGVDTIASRHPMGYGMPVGERGDTLSGGQKQVIALARALLIHPEVLLLDEPTSGMDMSSERTVLQALAPAMESRTVVIVTHRPALLQFVDRVIVMDEGIKVADGPKDEVIQMLNDGKVPSGASLRSALQAHVTSPHQ
ncbi:type I secretion system permease/ATPase [Budvicia diplopodorum]|uniref:type I secretion system permease/ATPase n=1 Tax=Budvicia diplopodorum TaxID=1119056 RepID=UPI001356BC13|nr:type I secretion system permease/ATPase [Budvicia diplopodorum]